MTRRFSGADVEVNLPTGKVALFDEVTVNASLGVGAAMSGGKPAGWTRGEVSGEGEIKLDTEELLKLLAEADAAGSWEVMDAMDMVLYSAVGGQELKVEVFGCKFDAPDFPISRTSGETIKHSLKFQVTGEDFIKVNGVALAESRR